MPWAAKVKLANGRLDFDFRAGNFVGEWNIKHAGRGDLHIDAAEGDAICWGIKDTRGHKEPAYAIIKNGKLEPKEKTEIYDYLSVNTKNPANEKAQEAIEKIKGGDYKSAIEILGNLVQ
jgi:hypothetical protein